MTGPIWNSWRPETIVSEQKWLTIRQQVEEDIAQPIIDEQGDDPLGYMTDEGMSVGFYEDVAKDTKNAVKYLGLFAPNIVKPWLGDPNPLPFEASETQEDEYEEEDPLPYSSIIQEIAEAEGGPTADIFISAP